MSQAMSNFHLLQEVVFEFLGVSHLSVSVFQESDSHAEPVSQVRGRQGLLLDLRDWLEHKISSPIELELLKVDMEAELHSTREYLCHRMLEHELRLSAAHLFSIIEIK